MHDIQEKLIELSKKSDITKLGYRKIGQMIGVNHPQQIKHHLTQLMKKGHIKLDKSSNFIDTIKISNLGQPTFTKIPVYGSANCGPATYLAEDRIEGYIEVSDSLLKNKNVIALRAMGNSLNRADINKLTIEEGDYVLFDPNNKRPRNGDYVVSIIDNAANIKKFMKTSEDQIALLSESDEKFSPIYISENDSYVIGGVVTQVIKGVGIKTN